jgi:hypothetical protein
MKARPWLVLTTLLAAACSNASPPDTTAAITTPAAPTSAPVTTITLFGPTTTTEPEAEPAADPARLAAIVLFPEDLPEAYRSLLLKPADSGFRPVGATLSSALEPADEADDIVRFGLLGGFTTTFGSSTDLWISFEASAFADPAGAGAYLADWQEDLARRTAAIAEGSELLSFDSFPDPTAADEAVRALYALAGADPAMPDLQGAVRVARCGPPLAWVWAVGTDPEAAIDALAPLVEDRLLSTAAGAAPPRDPAVLGLARSPIELLDSFAFEYSHGLETGAPGGGFRVDVTGEFQSPDRTSCWVSYTTDGEETLVARLVAIGTRVWLGGRTDYQEVPLRHPSALTDLPLCPGHPLFWEDTGYHRLPEAAGTAETLDGRPVLRSDLAGDPAALEALGYSAPRAERVTRYLVIRAAEGGWPLEMDVQEEMSLAEARRTFGLSTGPAGDDLPATIFTRLQLTRIDDPSLRVEPPLTAG